MIVCFCASITDTQIAEAIAEDRLSELYEAGLGQGCKSCFYDIREIVEEIQKN